MSYCQKKKKEEEEHTHTVHSQAIIHSNTMDEHQISTTLLYSNPQTTSTIERLQPCFHIL